MNNTLKKFFFYGVPVFLLLTVSVYALGTWDTWYRAQRALNTIDTNLASPFDRLYSYNYIETPQRDAFIPTKTIDEIKALWANAPDDLTFRTDKKKIIDYISVPWVRSYRQDTEAKCDSPEALIDPNVWHYVSQSRFQILEITSPINLEVFLNLDLWYSAFEAGQPAENIRLILQKEWWATVSQDYLINDIYDDGSWTSGNSPDLDIDNDGNDDLYIIEIPDQWDGPVGSFVELTVDQMIKLSTWINYIRIEWSDYGCETNTFINESISFDDTYGWDIWFSSALDTPDFVN